MKVLITGIKGQLGRSLVNNINSSIHLLGLDKQEFNIINFSKCNEFINKHKPNWIINTAAYTSVDLAESDKENAFKVNAYAVENLAKSITNIGGNLLQISTDFVFDGKSNIAYQTQDKCNPINVYGDSKYKGEQLALKYPGTYILRTSWLYSQFGKNFCLTMLKLHKKYSAQNSPLKVVCDQIGSPTSCKTLANICLSLISNKHKLKLEDRIFHWSDSGVASWYDFAAAIGDIGYELNLINKPAEIIPVKSIDFKTFAKRPNFSSLDCNKIKYLLNIKQTYWRNSLKDVMKSINKSNI